MTVTDTRPEQTTGDDQPRVQGSAPPGLPETVFTTSDHRRLGRYYVVASLVFVLVSVVIGVLLEIELSAKGIQIVGKDWDRLFALHATAGAVLFLPGLWIGIATAIVPLQVGAGRLAFPRLGALAFWTYAGAGSLLLGSYAVGTPRGTGILSTSPVDLVPRAGHATLLWAVALLLVTAAIVLAAANLLVTVLKLRVDGLTFGRLPAFSWSILAVCGATLLAGPLFIAGMILVFMDQRYGGGVLVGPAGANLWQHLVWLYGRPDGYLVVVPCLGALTDMVVTHGRRPLVDSTAAKGLIFAAAVLSFAILTADGTITTSALLPTPSILSVAVAVPVGLLALLWLASIRPQELRFHVSLLYLVGFALLLVAAGANAIIAPSQHLPGGTTASEWTVGQIHAVLFAAPTLALFGAVYHWSPRIFGRALNQMLGVLQWLLLLVGFGATAAAQWLAGYDGAPWHVANYAQAKANHFYNYAKLATAGGVLVALGLLVFVANAGLAWWTGSRGPQDVNPYDAGTLEWAGDLIPDVRSDTPVADLQGAK